MNVQLSDLTKFFVSTKRRNFEGMLGSRVGVQKEEESISKCNKICLEFHLYQEKGIFISWYVACCEFITNSKLPENRAILLDYSYQCEVIFMLAYLEI